ncbi:MAG TPA: hypothetical protein VHX12_02750 [Acidisoma sp.]|jgi:hypothetical protein|nr:hypothetical protein [Acidisoma sp.]
MSGRLGSVLALIREEAVGLFVDDGVFAGTIILWLVIAGALLPRLALPAWLPGPLLFAGLAAILVWGAIRACHKRGF